MITANRPYIAEQMARNKRPMVTIPVASFDMNIVVSDDNAPAVLIPLNMTVSTRPAISRIHIKLCAGADFGTQF
jgi:hypothetical protein